MNSSQKDNLSSALNSLRDEEERISSEMSRMQMKLDDVRAAILSVSKLIAPSEARQASLPLTTTEVLPKSPYEGLTIRQGIVRYLSRYPKPATTADIAEKMIKDGFPNDGKNFMSIVYTNLRRGQDEDFHRDTKKKWSLTTKS